eukprot:CAMPEP_0185017688 /NCGR_PEP_ID=MMETSP1103-20130426/603_1 /TAXON_ID=36769 /ORGANISM="Paraphysomonas bandaiensis, Strain Caron Lab Isolate" /LENGTH=61 /DNA_ID=CAMNT_0027547211 /DNA_START=435 /DNA_END=620 /DNA_ORIENTATION=-
MDTSMGQSAYDTLGYAQSKSGGRADSYYDPPSGGVSRGIMSHHDDDEIGPRDDHERDPGVF